MPATPPTGSEWQPQRRPEGEHPAGHAEVPPSDPLVPANLGGWFEKIVGVIRRSFVPLLAIQIGVVVANVILEVIVRQLSGGSSADNGLLMGSVIVNSFAQAASIFVAIRDAAGESTSVRTALKFVEDRGVPLLGWGIVAGIITMVGLVLFIVPGIYLAIVFSATLTGVVAVERKNIGRCFQLVNRRLWPTTGRMLLSFLIWIIYLVGIIGITVITDPNSLAATVLVEILLIPLGIAVVAATLVTYAELRFHENPDVLTPTLAAELRR